MRGGTPLTGRADPPHLPIRDAFPALVAGDALGNLTPLGPLVSEPVKAAFVRRRLPLMPALAGVAVENLLYTLSVAVVIGAGTIALLFVLDTSETIRRLATWALGAVVIAVAAGAFVLARETRVLTRTVEWLDRRQSGPSALVSRLVKLRRLEGLVFGFAARHPGRVWLTLLLEASFHVVGVVEIWLTLALLAGAAAPTLLGTFVLEAVNRTIMVVFKFVPLRLGVDEIGTEVLTRTLGLPPGLGVTMAVIRKARMIVWSAIGVSFLARRGLTPGDAYVDPAR